MPSVGRPKVANVCMKERASTHELAEVTGVRHKNKTLGPGVAASAFAIGACSISSHFPIGVRPTTSAHPHESGASAPRVRHGCAERAILGSACARARRRARTAPRRRVRVVEGRRTGCDCRCTGHGHARIGRGRSPEHLRHEHGIYALRRRAPNRAPGWHGLPIERLVWSAGGARMAGDELVFSVEAQLINP
jgi:hypothetical protein